MADASDRRLLAIAAGAAGAGLLVAAAAAARRRAAAASSAPPRAPTGFDAYLKDASVVARAATPPRPAFAATSFEAFLRQPAAGAPRPPDAASAPAPAGPQPPDGARPVTVLFGTEYGFSREVAERACAALRAAGGGAEFWPRLLDMAALPGGLPGLDAQQALLVVCSTQGDGVPPAEARAFCDWLAGGGAPRLDAAPLRFSVCALGDRSYQHFCRCGRTLDARLEALGGQRLAPRVDVNREDWAAVDGWIGAALAALRAAPLQTVAQLGGGAAAALGAAPGEEPAERWSKARPYGARVVALEELCAVSAADDKRTVRVELDLGDSGLGYEPGDALGVWPTNCPQAVEELLGVLGADGDALVAAPAWHYADPLQPAEAGAQGCARLRLRDALARCYDLRQPRAALLPVLAAALAAGEAAGEAAAAADASAQAARRAARRADKPGGGGGKRRGSAGHTKAQDSASELSGGTAAARLCAGGAAGDRLQRLSALVADPAAAEAYLAPRHVVDVLREFGGGAALAPETLLRALRQLQPRLYSISSSQLEHPRRVQATVAVVRYTSLGAPRLGVCSTQLGERMSPGQTLPVYIHHNPDFRLPPDAATPIVMVGPGTGLAPFRAFMQQRLLAAQAGGAAPGPALLFFGCRRRDQDFLYGAQLEGWAAEGALELHTAFSREQERKVYVQDRLEAAGTRVWQLLEAGGHVYVCGDAGSMAGAVEAALLRVIEAGLGSGGPEAAAAHLARLAAEGRYQRDVWLS